MLRLLGPLEVIAADGRPIMLAGRERLLLAALALAGPSPVSTERLIDELWPRRAPANSLNVLRNVVMRLRRALGDQDELAVDGRPGGYLLRRAPTAVDLDVATTLVADAETANADGNQVRRAALLEQAIALWRGPAFDGFDELPGVAAERARFEELGVTAREQWVDTLLEIDRTSDAVVALDALCAQYPFRELLWQQRLIALHRLGRDNDAIDAARAYRRMLRDELGLDPGPSWRELEQAVLSRDPKLRRTQAELPSGTVTFVRFEFDPPEDDDAVARWPTSVTEMGAILDSIVTAHGGSVAENAGTRLTAAFAQPADAVTAAAAAARAGQARTAPVAHRTGVHTGEATPQHGRYIGLAVHQVERVAAAAHHGQVLVSGTTAQLLPAGGDAVPLIDLGRFRIAGIPGDTTLHQLAGDNTPNPSLPPRALVALTVNLPQKESEFVGREEELGEVRALLASSRVVTVVGPAGVGKTRLAIELAIEGSARDGACFVALAQVTEPALLGVAVAEALGVDVGTSPDAVGPIVDALAVRPTLLVLDNCEHLADAASDLVDAVTARCRAARVLATSREPLGVAAEAVWRLAPLSIPAMSTAITAAEAIEHDAVRLLAIRLREADATFAVDETVAPIMCDVVRALDGLPLAIELAAPIAAALGLDELRRGLDDRLDLLEMSRRRGDPRHHLLRTALEWSHALLTEDERLLYRRMGVFEAPVDLLTMTRVCGEGELDERRIRRATAKLVSRSLVMRVDHDDATRFGLLETMKVHARELLDHSDDRLPVGRRHADWVAARTTMVRVDQPTEFAALTSQLLDFAGDLRAAVAFLIDEDPDAALQLLMSCRPMWDWMSRWSDITESLDRALAGAADTPPGVRAGMYMIRGFAMLSRDLREARHALANAAELYAVADEPGPHGLALQRLAGVACAQGDLALAERLAARARQIDLASGDQRLLAFLQQEYINLALARGDNRAVVELVDEVVPALRKSGQLVAALRMTTAKARALCRLGDLETALDLALKIVRETRSTPGAAPFNSWVNYALSEIELARENPPAAARYIADALADTLPSQPLRLAPLLFLAGSAAAATDQPREAVTLFGAAQTMRDRGGEAPTRGADGPRELQIVQLREQAGAQMFHQDWRRGADLADVGNALVFARNVLAVVRSAVRQ